jgi:hypothetical protein
LLHLVIKSLGMKIKVDKVEGGFRADFIDLPGSPFVGDGPTEAEAIATLFIRNKEGFCYLDFDYLEINGKPYESIYKNDR